MDIRLLQIKYENIREMKDLVVDLCCNREKSDTSHITLIQMPNGVGKTTTMELIRYCLDGSATEMKESKITSFRSLTGTSESGMFQLKLSIEGDIYFIELHFNFSVPSVEYYTIKTSERSGGKRKGLNIPADVKAIITKKFVRLFVFDGELAGELLDPEVTSAEEAIQSLYNLDKILDLKNKVDQLVNEKMERVEKSGVKTNQGILALKTKYENAKEVKKAIEKTVSEKEGRQIYLKKEIDRHNKKIQSFREKNEENNKKFGLASEKLVKLNSHLERRTQDLMAQMRFPYNMSDNVWKMMDSLGNRMIKLKLPRTQSIEFFNELANSSECICGRPIDEKHREIIIRKSKEYLTEDNIGVINSIKASLRSLPQREKIEEIIKEINDLKTQKSLTEQEITALNKKLIQSGSEEIADNEKKIKEYDDENKEIKEYLAILNEKDMTELESMGVHWKDNMYLCNKHVEKLEREMAEATNTVEFKNKADALKEILDEIYITSMAKLKTYITGKTNERIKRILKTEDIQITRIANSLYLKDRTGVSEGQKLSIAYAFLSTLFHESSHKIPFVVDTPAAPLDLEVRREVSKTIPSLFSQIVIFIISPERDGFADRFYCDKDGCKFITIRKNREKGVVELEENLEYFKNFQSED